MVKDATSEHLRAELKSLPDTLEELLRSFAQKPKAEFEKLRTKAESALKDTSSRLGNSGERLAEQPAWWPVRQMNTYTNILGRALALAPWSALSSMHLLHGANHYDRTAKPGPW